MRRGFTWTVVAMAAAWGCRPGSERESVDEAAVSTSPDYAITAISAPPSALPGSRFNITTTICNVGGAVAPATSIQIVASLDTAIDTSDPVIGWRFPPALDPGQCDTGVTQVVIEAVDTFHVGAMADPLDAVIEDSETNNRLISDAIAIGWGPDLVVTAMTGPASADRPFLINSTVCNRGTQPSERTVVSYYASVDPIIVGRYEGDDGDTLLSTHFVGPLQPGQCDSGWGDASPPGYAGSFYLGAIVNEDLAIVELIDSNNHFTGPQIAFGTGPDLVVTAVSGPPSASGSFIVDATVCNQGTQPSFPTDVRFYLSTDPIITGSLESPHASDGFLGALLVDTLDPGACASGSKGVAPSPRTGARYLGAIVDEAGELPELNETNNHTTGPLIALGNGPDLVVTSVSGPPTASVGFSIASTVCNRGTQPSPGFDVRFYASADATITGTVEDPASPDFWLGVRSVGALDPGQCDSRPAPVSAPPHAGSFTLGAIADEADNVTELIESNNHTAGSSLLVGDGPDLVVTSLSGPPAAGGPFVISSTVCNQGTQPSRGLEVRFFASVDSEITDYDVTSASSDPWIGSRFVDYLPAGDCDSAPVTVAAPGITGVFYLGAIVHQTAGTAELSESNNRITGSLIGLGNGPDLVVTAIAGPPSASGPFTLTSTVCNQGTQPSNSFVVDFYASADPTIIGWAESWYSSDLWLGQRYIDPLAPGQCDTGSTYANPQQRTGAFYLGAVVDEYGEVAESVESNNHTTGPLIGIGSGPDLVVMSISAPPSASAPFAIASAVCNQGTQPSPGTEVRFYASTDATITGSLESPRSADVLLGSRLVGPLQPGQCDRSPTTATPPPGLGAFTLGATVDEAGQIAELIETNNHTTGPPIGIGNGPDLVVTSVSAPATANASFVIASTVCNQGTQPTWGDVAFYASTGPTITGMLDGESSSHVRLGGHYVLLPPGQCDTSSTVVSRPSNTGVFYLIAIADPSSSVPELIESNNSFTGPLIGIGDGPDLVVTSISAPPSATGTFAIGSTVCNQGTRPSPATSVTLYASPDATITGNAEAPMAPDISIGSRSVGPLSAGQCDTGSIDAWASGNGAFYLGAIVDETGQVAELLESNNHTTGPLIGFGDGPDLVITSLSGPPAANAAFAITATVCNQGTRAVSNAEVRFYASPDPTITGISEASMFADLLLGSNITGSLAPGQCETRSTAVSPPPDAGVFYLGATVDETGAIRELIESNNHTTGPRIGVGNGPELVVTAIAGPPSASAPFAVATTVCNLGTAPSPSAELRLYASTDATITGSLESPSADPFLGARSVPPLVPGQCDTASTTATPPPEQGAFYLGAIVDEAGQVAELLESKNHTTGPRIGLGNGPDLVVTSLLGPPAAGGLFTITATVCNQGTQPSAAVEVHFYASADVTITGTAESASSSDVILGSRVVGPLSSGQCDTGSADAFPPPATGAFYLGAIVDELDEVSELVESNNHTTGAPITFGDGPDLVVTKLSGPPTANASFSIDSTICNQGTRPSPAFQVSFYASADSTLTGMTEGPESPDYFLGWRAVDSLGPGACDSTPADVYPPWMTGPFYLGAIVDEYQQVSELIESNNRFTGAPITFGDGPDLVVTSVAPASSASAPFAIASTVCNQGDQPASGFDVRFYASADAIITGSFEAWYNADLPLGARYLDSLAPGQCDTSSIDATPPPGMPTFYLGAIVNEGGWMFELNSANNHTTGLLVRL